MDAIWNEKPFRVPCVLPISGDLAEYTKSLKIYCNSALKNQGHSNCIIKNETFYEHTSLSFSKTIINADVIFKI